MLFTLGSLTAMADQNTPQEPRIIKVALLDHSEPFVVKQGDSYRGLLVDMLKEAVLPSGAEFQVVIRPYARAIPELLAGKLDVMFLIRIPGRATFPPTDKVIISQPILVTPLNLYAREDNDIVINTPTDLGKYHLGGVRIRGIKHEAKTPGDPKTSYFNNPEQLFKSLVTGRIDMAITGPIIANYWQEGLQARFVTKLQLGKTITQFIFSKASLQDAAIPLCTSFMKQWATPRTQATLQESAKRYKTKVFSSLIRIPPPTMPDEELCFSVKDYLEYEKKAQSK
ncbi:hypothetical protein R50073_16220 [Maricurvus nonylphenolicus]